MSDKPEFKSFEKIARLNREVIATEKLDGTNGVVHVAEDGTVLAGSRTRWITPAEDNFNFAKWVAEHADELRVGLGFGTHYGEWWGAGIGRRYGLAEKRFSLFNVARWSDPSVRPACCGVVPELCRGTNISDIATRALHELQTGGSIAAPGFMHPEGIVLFHTASQTLYKVTLDGDGVPKSKATPREPVVG